MKKAEKVLYESAPSIFYMQAARYPYINWVTITAYKNYNSAVKHADEFHRNSPEIKTRVVTK